jgi:hypothetical protein
MFETAAQVEIKYRQERLLAEATSHRLARIARQTRHAERTRVRRFTQVLRELGRSRHAVRLDVPADAKEGPSRTATAAIADHAGTLPCTTTERRIAA